MGTLRIIGGQWRGRKLHFPDVKGLRPTPDRVRETLFNWLMPVMAGARFLDPFAGSGALGLEAASRGAARVVMLDRHRHVVQRLRDHVQLLGTDSVEVLQGDALKYLQGAGEPFDVIFLDPPYSRNLLAPCCELLESHGWLAPQAHIYLEAESSMGEPVLPEQWTLIRSKCAGDVGYHLARRNG